MILIDLSGPDGNAFSLMAYATRLARQLGLDGENIREQMMAGNYANLLRVFQAHFGDYVEFE